jgi:hypothetical protein
MSEIDKEDIIIIILSLLITGLFIMCIKCYYAANAKNSKLNQNDFIQISKALNNNNITTIGYNERTRLI